MDKKILIWTLVFILIASNAAAFGVGPAKREFDYDGMELSGSFRIETDEIPMKVLISPENELAEYIEIDSNSMLIEKQSQTINYKIKLPPDVKPGIRKGGILIVQVPDDSILEKENVVLATAGVIHQIRVHVPYPGKYLEGKVMITNKNVDENILFTVPVYNFGEEDLDSIKATIHIKGSTNEEIAVIETNEISLKSQDESKLTAIWSSKNAGLYHAEVIINYDGKQVMYRESFEIGDASIVIEDLIINNFRLGQISKVELILANNWNQPISTTGYIEVLKQNKKITSLDTIPITIPAMSKSTMIGYWDTSGLDIGEYDLHATVNYDQKQTERLFSTVVSLDEFKVKDQITAQAISGEEGKRSSLLIVLVIMLIIINIGLFAFVIKKIKK